MVTAHSPARPCGTQPSVKELFTEAQSFVKSLPPASSEAAQSGPKVSDSDRLQLYGLFKCATAGPCKGGKAPGVWDMVGRAKYKAWESVGDLSKEEAMRRYAAKLTEIYPAWRGSSAAKGGATENRATSSGSDDQASSSGSEVSSTPTGSNAELPSPVVAPVTAPAAPASPGAACPAEETDGAVLDGKGSVPVVSVRPPPESQADVDRIVATYLHMYTNLTENEAHTLTWENAEAAEGLGRSRLHFMKDKALQDPLDSDALSEGFFRCYLDADTSIGPEARKQLICLVPSILESESLPSNLEFIKYTEPITSHAYERARPAVRLSESHVLLGVACRQKKIGFINITGYTVALYVSRACVDGLRQQGWLGLTIDGLVHAGIFEWLSSSGHNMTMRMVMYRDIDRSRMVGALEESLKPRMKYIVRRNIAAYEARQAEAAAAAPAAKDSPDEASAEMSVDAAQPPPPQESPAPQHAPPQAMATPGAVGDAPGLAPHSAPPRTRGGRWGSVSSAVAAGKHKSMWMPDDKARACCRCKKEFNFINRKHHCRSCGMVVCHDCSSRTVRLQGRGSGRHRVCDVCISNSLSPRQSREASPEETAPIPVLALGQPASRTQPSNDSESEARTTERMRVSWSQAPAWVYLSAAMMGESVGEAGHLKLELIEAELEDGGSEAPATRVSSSCSARLVQAGDSVRSASVKHSGSPYWGHICEIIVKNPSDVLEFEIRHGGESTAAKARVPLCRLGRGMQSHWLDLRDGDNETVGQIHVRTNYVFSRSAQLASILHHHLAGSSPAPARRPAEGQDHANSIEEAACEVMQTLRPVTREIGHVLSWDSPIKSACMMAMWLWLCRRPRAALSTVPLLAVLVMTRNYILIRNGNGLPPTQHTASVGDREAVVSMLRVLNNVLCLGRDVMRWEDARSPWAFKCLLVSAVTLRLLPPGRVAALAGLALFMQNTSAARWLARAVAGVTEFERLVIGQ